MKFVILHGTDADHTQHWFPWLKAELEELGHEVWVPDLPSADHPNIKTYNDFLLNSGYDFSDCVMVGHSSGSVEINGLLQELPKEVNINSAILVGTFVGDLGWESLEGVNIPFDFEKIKTKAKKFIVIHSDNDPYCPLPGAQEVSRKLEAEFVLLPGQGHFTASLDPRFEKFPELLQIIKEKVL